MPPSHPREYLAFPLDVSTIEEARSYVELLKDAVGVFKVGFELYTAVGPEAVRVVHDFGCRCFLDIKLHDIPATMCRAVSSAAALKVEYLTLHASSGPTALSEVAKEVSGTDMKLLAVTLLTSLDSIALEKIGFKGSVEQVVRHLARLALDNGINGFVTSAQECESLRQMAGDKALLVTPGIRPLGAMADDQLRTATPAQAIRAGSDLLVIGRPIRDALDPLAAAQAICDEIASALP